MCDFEQPTLTKYIEPRIQKTTQSYKNLPRAVKKIYVEPQKLHRATELQSYRAVELRIAISCVKNF